MVKKIIETTDIKISWVDGDSTLYKDCTGINNDENNLTFVQNLDEEEGVVKRSEFLIPLRNVFEVKFIVEIKDITGNEGDG